MGEMVLVLVFAFLFGVAALVFAVQRSAGQAEQELAQAQDQELALTAKQLATMPSIRHSLVGQSDLTVVDARRASTFAELLAEPAFRSTFRERYAGYSARITPVYPQGTAYTAAGEAAPFDTIELFDFTDPDSARRSSIPFTIPVLLFDPVSNHASFALLTVTQVNQ
jgi:hypothetical protein